MNLREANFSGGEGSSLRWPESKLERREMASTSHSSDWWPEPQLRILRRLSRKHHLHANRIQNHREHGAFRAPVSSFCMHGAALASACQFLPLTCVRIPSPSRSSVKAPCRPVNESSSLYNCGKNTERDAIAATCAAAIPAARER